MPAQKNLLFDFEMFDRTAGRRCLIVERLHFNRTLQSFSTFENKMKFFILLMTVVYTIASINMVSTLKVYFKLYQSSVIFE